MIELVWDPPFVRALQKWRRRHPDLSDRFQQRLRQFRADPFQPSLHTHALTGPLKGLHAFSITRDHRLVFRFVGDGKALLIDIGSHEEVY